MPHVLVAPRISQPALSTPINWGNPLTRGLTTALDFNGAVFDVAKGTFPSVTTLAGSLTFRQTLAGTALYTDTNTIASLALNEDWVGASTTAVQILNLGVDSPWGGLFTKLASGTVPQVALQRESSSDNWRANTTGSGGLVFTSSSISATIGIVTTLAVVVDGPNIGNSVALYRNGAFIQTLSSIQPQSAGTGDLLLSAEGSASAAYSSDTYWLNLYRFNRALSPDEIFQLGNNASAKLRKQWRITVTPGAVVDPILSNLVAINITSSGATPRVDYIA